MKAKPGSVNHGSAGSGAGMHLTVELFKIMTKVDIVHVPYKGTGPAMIDLIGGQIQMMFAGTLEQFWQVIKDDPAKWRRVVKETKITAD